MTISTLMNTSVRTSGSVNSRQVLLPFVLTTIAAMIVVQLVIAVTGGEVTVLTAALTAFVALGIGAWLLRSRRALHQIRFATVIAHAIAYATVTTSFTLHALIRIISLVDASAAGHLLLTTPWFRATLVMSGVWGLGLLLHLLGDDQTEPAARRTGAADRQPETKEWLADRIDSWVETYKKSMLIPAILSVVAAHQPTGIATIAEAVAAATGEDVTERGLYRTCRWLQDSGLLASTDTDAPRTGAKRKVLSLTELGTEFLAGITAELIDLDPAPGGRHP